MKKHLIKLLLAGALCLPVTTTFTGCAILSGNTAPETMAMYVADMRDIGELGTRAALMENADLKPEIIKARDSLKALESLPDGDVTLDDLIAVVSKLPIDALQTPRAQLYIFGGKILLRHVQQSVNLSQISNIKPLVTALRQGMDAGLQ